ncbi:MAG: VapC toxin family PIN domain ribonuclease [Thermoprotei archaeon]|mgnify:CR=1 FL=1|nr:MAG: VapC toxin family PIN domain ribonuclease [Thermoprotei archaeon]
MKLLLDTNVLVYDTVEDSPQHKLAVKIIDNAGSLYITSLVIFEYLWILLKKLNLNPEFAKIKLREYLEDPRTIYVCEDLDLLEKALKYMVEDRSPPHELNDYIILCAAETRNATLATFDKKLAKIAEKRGVTTIP